MRDACRDGLPVPEEQLESLNAQLASRDEKIDELEAYIANIMREGISNNVVLKELHDALAAKDSAIAELQAYIDSELRATSQTKEEQESAALFKSQDNSGKAELAPAEDDSAQPEALSYGQTTLKISQLKAQIHRLESRLDSSSSESSSDEEAQPEEEDVQKSWWSAKAENLTAEVVRLQAEAAEAEERHARSLQVRLHISLRCHPIDWHALLKL